MRRILFVDDEQNVLDGLQNLLRKQRRQWEMVFALGGQAALDELAKAPFDVIVSDIQMPGLDGVALLARVKEKYPSVARIVLSGHAEQKALVRVLPVAHQFLNKPCDADTLRAVIERTCALQTLLSDQAIRSVLGKMNKLPSLPQVYHEFCAAAAKPDVGLADIAEIVEKDSAMSLKVLQLVNSAYFGVAEPITTIRRAVTYVGVEMLKGLSLTAHLFSTTMGEVEGFSPQSLQQHSLHVARLSKRLLTDRKRAEEAFTASLVHDIGRLVIAAELPARAAEIARTVRTRKCPAFVAEKELLGVTHAEIGAYLAGVWGLPFSIVEAVAYHHTPDQVGEGMPELVATLHIADALVGEASADEAEQLCDSPLDLALVERAGLTAQLPQWRAWATEECGRTDTEPTTSKHEIPRAPPAAVAQRKPPVPSGAAADIHATPRATTVEPVSRARVLCVDDERNVLEGLTLHLRRRYDVQTAGGGAEALALLQKDASIAVIVSDMRMPGMDGAKFLARARELVPNSVRILLTGQADMNSAISAVNEGQIFRFLTKPCPPAALLAAVDAAAEQHRLITAERVLLEQTLHGSIRALIDILSLTSPVSFGRATRIKKHVSDVAEKLGLRERWQVEVSAMLSQLGCITLPPETVEKLYYGRALTPEEQKMVARMPTVSEQLLGNIPRLEVVREILATYTKPFKRSEGGEDTRRRTVERGAAILRLAVDFDALEAKGNAPSVAIATLREHADQYAPEVLQALAALHDSDGPRVEQRELAIGALSVGMVLAEDVKLVNGTLLVARGYEVTAGFIERVRNFRAGTVKESVRVLVKK